jgi:DNA (cytosine-5)-methyltransferase 1
LKKDAIPLLSFFTGGGFLDLGFEKAGFEIVWTNEFNPDFADMYEYAMSKLSSRRALISSRKSITSLSAKEVLAAAFPKGCPTVFGVIGGPPCTDFSNGGKKRGFDGDRGKLTRTYLRMVGKISPAFFVMENVKGLKRMKKERSRLMHTLRWLARKGRYDIRCKVLNALELGVPQDRERFFIVGVKKDLISRSGISFEWPVEHRYSAAKGIDWPKISPFKGKPKRAKKIPVELTVGHAFSFPISAEKAPNGKEHFVAYSSKFKKRKEGDVQGKSFKRLHRHRYSPTAWYGNNEVHLHPWKARRITVREALRIQTLPDLYVLPPEKTLSSKFKMICNGVPFVMAQKIGESLKNYLDRLSSIR